MHGEGFVSLGLSETVGDEIAQMNIGGQLLMGAGLGRVVMMPDGLDQFIREIPTSQEASADFRMFHSKNCFLGFEERQARRTRFFKNRLL